jgi:AraC family transcriptional regulator
MRGAPVIERKTDSGSTIRLVRYAPSEHHPFHAHRSSSITLVLRGSIEEDVGDAHAVGTPLSVVIKPAGVPHADRFGDDGAMTVQIVLSRDEEAAARDSGHDLGPWRWSHAGGAIRPMLAIAHALRAPSPGAPARDALDELFVETLACLAETDASIVAGAPPWLAEVREALDAESLPIRQLARRARVHPIHLAREFRRHFGITPSEHRRRMRLSRAADLLTGQRSSLAAIAFEAGFSDQAHMSRDMRSGAGVTPSAIRRLAATDAAAR